MMKWSPLGIALAVTPVLAETPAIAPIVDAHILTSSRMLALESAALAQAATPDCAPESSALRAAYHDAFDAWVGVLYAREYLLYDAQLLELENTFHRCTLIQAVTLDIAANADAILAEWDSTYANLMREPGNDIYRSDSEAAQQLFTALLTGLEFTAGTRIGRPIGSFERPRPTRADSPRWR